MVLSSALRACLLDPEPQLKLRHVHMCHVAYAARLRCAVQLLLLNSLYHGVGIPTFLDFLTFKRSARPPQAQKGNLKA
jgi:hypothetical protein